MQIISTCNGYNGKWSTYKLSTTLVTLPGICTIQALHRNERAVPIVDDPPGCRRIIRIIRRLPSKCEFVDTDITIRHFMALCGGAFVQPAQGFRSIPCCGEWSSMLRGSSLQSRRMSITTYANSHGIASPSALIRKPVAASTLSGCGLMPEV